MADPKLVVVDGNSILYRAFFALPPLTLADGTPTNAVYGFAMMLLRLLEEEKPEVLVIAQEGGRTFRHEQFGAYKGQRPATPSDLAVQGPLARQVADVLRIPQVQAPGYEADDVVGTLACRGKAAGYQVLIVTGDLDALQLVDDRVRVMVNRRGITDTVVYDAAAVRERFGLEPGQLPDFKALKGDPSDNIPGVPGIGDKTAARLIGEYGSLESLLRAVGSLPPSKVNDALREHAARAAQYKVLATIVTDVAIATPFEEWQYPGPDPGAARELFSALEFRTLLRKLPEPVGADPLPPPVDLDPSWRQPATDADLEAFARRARASGRVVFRLLPTGNDRTGRGFAGAAFRAAGETIGVGAAQGGTGSEQEWSLPEPLRELLLDPAIEVGGYQVKADLHRLAWRPGDAGPRLAFDPLLAAYVLNPGRSSYRLEDLAREQIGAELGETSDPLDRLAGEVAAVDALWEPMIRRLEAEELGRVFDELELPLVPVLAKMEAAGILVDVGTLHALSERLGRRIEALQQDAYRMAGRSFNLGSPKQLQTVLFEELGLQSSKKTATGQASTSVDVLEELAAEHPIVAAILEFREHSKLKSTYADALPNLLDPATGRVHTTLNQAVAATGRLSSSEPNLQNIPVRTEVGREIRAAFVAPPGWALLSADYSQIELRILAHVTGDPELTRAFREGEDVHLATAARIFGIPPAAVSPELRRRGKTLNFAVIYGMSDFGLARELGIPVKAARELIDAYFARFPGVRRYAEETLRAARELGYVTTLPPYRRRRYIPGLNAGSRNERQVAERAAVNAPIQGTAADIIKHAMIRIDAAARGRGLRSRMLLQVHDELLFELHPAEREELVALVGREMPAAAELEVPLDVDVKLGPNWRDMEPA